jgi:hypothetical protein
MVLLDKQLAAQPEGSPATFLPAQRKDFSSAVNLLTQLRRELLISKLGAAPLALDAWESNETAYLNGKQQLPADLATNWTKSRPGSLKPLPTKRRDDEFLCQTTDMATGRTGGRHY